MTVPNLPNTWRITYAGTVAGNVLYPWEVVVHATGLGSGVPQNVANEAGAAWVTTGSWRDIQTNNIKLGNITVQSLDGVSAPLSCVVTGYTNVNGGTAGQAVPIQAAALVTKSSGLAGRRNRGRMYVPGLSTTLSATDGTGWTSTGVTGIAAAAAAWKTKLEGGPILTNLVVYSLKFNTKVNVTSLITRAYFGTQRRRSEPG